MCLLQTHNCVWEEVLSGWKLGLGEETPGIL